jgi:serpin B
MRKYLILLVSGVVVGYSALAIVCVGLLNAEESKEKVDDRLVSANTRFGFNLFREIVKDNSTENIFISPSSAAFALAMTYNGARGETKEAMAKTLGLEEMSTSEVNKGNSILMSELESPDSMVELTIANSLWMKKGIRFNPEFIKTIRDFYDARATDLDFTDPGAPGIINTWVKKNTKEKIDKIIEKIDPLTVLFLINAVYFKGTWTHEFDKKQTKEGMFTLLDGNQKKHPMMNQSGRYRYLENEDFQAVSLPYGEERMSMYIFLPDSERGLEGFYQNLNAENWEIWMSRFKKMKGNVRIPRFKMKYEVVLNDVLKSLGMEVAFSPVRADFWRMFIDTKKDTKEEILIEDPRPYISIVKQKTFVEVNEEGTEAAAVTSVGITIDSYVPTFSMIVDRPFFFVIRDNETGTVLFMGSIVKPEEG